MKRIVMVFLMAASAFAAVSRSGELQENTAAVQRSWDRIKAAVESHLSRPYVWGACGLKSFDCSGFVWRVMADNGMLIKRTTARKLYMSLPRVAAGGRFDSGNIVFFDNLKHCGIVADSMTFYHAQSSIGTNLSRFDPYWRPKVCGFRAMPKTE